MVSMKAAKEVHRTHEINIGSSIYKTEGINNAGNRQKWIQDIQKAWNNQKAALILVVLYHLIIY